MKLKLLKLSTKLKLKLKLKFGSKQNNLTSGQSDLGIVRLCFQSVKYTPVFIYHRFTIVYTNIYSEGVH